MMQVKKYFGKTSGNPLLHYIFSFDSKVKNEDDAILMSIRIASYFQDRHQVLWAVHRKKRERAFYHVHLVVNSVSYVDGKMIDSWMTEIEKFRLYIQKLTGRLVQFHFSGDKEDV